MKTFTYKPRAEWRRIPANGRQNCILCDLGIYPGEFITNALEGGPYVHWDCADRACPEVYTNGVLQSTRGRQRDMVEHVDAHVGEWQMVRKVPGAGRSERYEWRTL